MPSSSKRRGFTLIELMVVIAVIAILAAMIFPITGAVNRAKIKSKARGEKDQIVTAISNYKVKFGHYPPDNPDNFLLNQLGLELLGSIRDKGLYTSLDGSVVIRDDQPTLTAAYGPKVTGLVNAKAPGGGDEASTAHRCLPSNLRPGQYFYEPNTRYYLLCSVDWPATVEFITGAPGKNPWRYISSKPIHNKDSYDLWVDVIVNGKTNRISNWSREPFVVTSPLP